jgi:hypothetical protein
MPESKLMSCAASVCLCDKTSAVKCDSVGDHCVSWRSYLPNALSSDQMRSLARLGAQARLEQIKAEIAGLTALIGEGGGGRGAGRSRTAPSTPARGRKRGKLSAAARARIAAAQRARWAKVKAAKSGDQKAAPATRRRRGMSPAQRKAVSERMKKYWASRRSGAKK